MSWLQKISRLDDFAYGVYEDESIGDRIVLQRIKQMSKELGSKTELHPEEQDPMDQQWHIRYIQVRRAMMDHFETLLQRGLSDEWYALLWDDVEIRVIFKNGTKHISNRGLGMSPSFDNNELANVAELAKQNNLDGEYMNDHLLGAMNDFTASVPTSSSR